MRADHDCVERVECARLYILAPTTVHVPIGHHRIGMAVALEPPREPYLSCSEVLRAVVGPVATCQDLVVKLGSGVRIRPSEVHVSNRRVATGIERNVRPEV